MASSVNYIESSELNRFTLSFKDPVLESAFLAEYGKNSLRVTLTYFPWIVLIFAIGLGVIMALVPQLTFPRNLLFCGLGFLVLLFLYFRLLPPSVHFMQFAFLTIGVLPGWFYAYSLIILQGSNLQTYVFVVIIIHTVSASLALPLRFVYSVLAVHIIWFGFGFVAFFLSNLNTVDALFQFLFLGCLNGICVFATYQREAATRLNFCQRRVIEEREARVSELSEFLKKMFGRYVSEEVMNALVQNPDSVRLGGEKRKVTMMMTDLRGFTQLSERLDPEKVMALLNRYFDVMMRICKKYHGTINDIFGDALLVTFGAPQEIEDHARAAVACAIEMQNAMKMVNEENVHRGLPKLDMGIGLNTADVVVGNIGTEERAKFGVVGNGVNMTSRIESYTVGGQILISESVRQEAGEVLRIDGQREVLPKGAETPLRVYDIGGIAGSYNLTLEEKDSALVVLTQKLPLWYTILEGKHVGKEGLECFVVRLSKKSAEIVLDEPIEQFTNLKLNLKDVYEELAVKDFYGKITELSGKDGNRCLIRFTSVPPEVVSYFLAHQQYATKPLAGGDS